jgi:dTDP-4-dehydrorhamnose 3,5-epimerase
MKSFKETNINGVYEIEMFHAGDERGMFVKPYHKATLEKHGLVSEFQESFYSTNQSGVIRGMHFQHPPHDHAKLVYCSSGKLIDVILDIRVGSPTYGAFAAIELSSDKYNAVYMPSGMAHGFGVLEDNTCMVYLTSTMHAPSADDGVKIDSFGFEWPFENPITSARDNEFKPLHELESPFIFHP